MNCITVLLATYNGSKYVRQMIDSVLAQDYQDFLLVLSDDCSKDGTDLILEEYATQYPDKITHYRSGLRFGNAQNHFMHLLQKFHDTPYIMFCDQDDYWHSNKIRKTLQKIQEIETDSLPAMVHTDLRVVDGDLQLMDPSFMHFSRLQGDRLALHQLLVQNVVTGCTMMLNRNLAVMATERLPADGIAMHDWWIALLASACGNIDYLQEATIDYRQHGNNSVGATSARSLRHILGKLSNNKIRTRMKRSFLQAEMFLTCFEDMLPKEKANLIRAYAKLKDANGLQRRIAYIKYGFLMDGLLKKAGQFLLG